MEDFFAGCFKVEDDEDQRFLDKSVTTVLKGGKKMIGLADRD